MARIKPAALAILVLTSLHTQASTCGDAWRSFFKSTFQATSREPLGEVAYSDWRELVTPYGGFNKTYEQAHNILLLSDVPDKRGDIPLADAVTQLYPRTRGKVVRGDILLEGDRVDDGIRHMHLDNCAPLPFAASSFDVIVLRKGICFCSREKPASCGGLPDDVDGSAQIISEMVRVFDSSKPHSVMFLQGFYPHPVFLADKRMDFWDKVIAQLQQRYANLQIQKVMSKGEFAGLLIRPSKDLKPHITLEPEY